MKYLIILSLLSFNVFAQAIEAEKSFQLAEKIKPAVVEEELGAVKSAQCNQSNDRLSCVFIFDLPVDYCWYGEFKVEATYELDLVTGAKLLDYQVNWQH